MFIYNAHTGWREVVNESHDQETKIPVIARWQHQTELGDAIRELSFDQISAEFPDSIRLLTPEEFLRYQKNISQTGLALYKKGEDGRPELLNSRFSSEERF